MSTCRTRDGADVENSGALRNGLAHIQKGYDQGPDLIGMTTALFEHPHVPSASTYGKPSFTEVIIYEMDPVDRSWTDIKNLPATPHISQRYLTELNLKNPDTWYCLELVAYTMYKPEGHECPLVVFAKGNSAIFYLEEAPSDPSLRGSAENLRLLLAKRKETTKSYNYKNSKDYCCLTKRGLTVD